MRYRRTGRRSAQTHRSSAFGRATALVALVAIVVVPLATSGPSAAMGSPRLAQLGYRLVGGDGGIFTLSLIHI